MKTHKILSLMTAATLSMGQLSYAAEHAPPKEESAKTSAEETRQIPADAAEEIMNYSADMRGEAVRKAKAALDALDAHINTLEGEVDSNWEKMDKAARDRARGTLRAIREQRIKAAEWYGGLINSSVNTWEEVKYGFLGAYKSLLHALDMAERERHK
jgi:hypothetical protein